MTYDFKLSRTLPAAPQDVYDAWLDRENGGWQNNDFAPMKAYFAREKSRGRPERKPAGPL